MLGEPAPARAVLVEHALPTIAAQPAPHVAGLRARRGGLLAAADRRERVERGAAPWLARRRPRRRFLPPRPAGRGAVPPHAAAGAARRDPRRRSRSPSSRCSSCGCGRSRSSRADSTCARRANNQLRTFRSRRRAARSSTATAACSSRTSGHGGRALAGRPAEDGAATRSAAARDGPRRPAVGDPARRSRAARGRPADAGDDPGRGPRATGRATSREHQSEFPGVDARRQLPAQVPAPGARRAGARLRRRDLARAAEAHADGGLRARATGSASPGSRRRTTRYLRGEAGVARAPRRLARPAESALSDASCRSPATRSGSRSTSSSSGRRAGARVRDRARAQSDGSWAANGGAIVAIDPNDGAILAMASYPTFKPSVFVGPRRREEARAAARRRDGARRRTIPALNRAIDGLYPPGSTFKPVTALAAMQEHLSRRTRRSRARRTRRDVTATARSSRTGTRTSTSRWTMPTALARLVRHVLLPARRRVLRAAARAAATRSRRWASRFGFGAPTGIDVGPEAGGPPADARVAPAARSADRPARQIDRLWKPGDSIQLAIGQKDLLVTPLQMARFYALIANGGKLVTPHVARATSSSRAANGAPRVQRFRPPPPAAERRRPGRARGRPDGLYDATHASYGTVDRASSATSRSPSPARRARPRRSSAAGLRASAAARPVVVVRLRAGRRQPDDRRLRRDRERRPRRHGRRARRRSRSSSSYFHAKAPAIGAIHSD